jgi:HEAT repeat protein
MTLKIQLVLFASLLLGGVVAARQARFDDVIRNLRNPDPKVRLAATRLLRESKYPEAVIPLASLVNDPVDAVQLEAIGAELAFFMVEDVPAKKRVALLVEKRYAERAPLAFDSGPLAVWPRPVPAALVSALLKAVDDDHGKVRLEAIYTLGTIVRPPLAADASAQLVKALDHYDPAIRAAAARVIGRLRVTGAAGSLIKAINDSQAPVRYAAMRALGELHEVDAVQALNEQLAFYTKGEGAWAALDALAHIAHPSSVPLFKTRLSDKDPFLRRAAADGLGRAGATSEIAALEIGAGNDPSEMVRAAMAFALQKMGKHYLPRLVESLDSAKMAPQIAEYLFELGPSIVPELVPHLQDPSPAIRANTAQILGALGGEAATAALQPLLQDRDRDVIQAATRALERIKMSAK